MKRILTAPARFVRGAWRFIDPDLKVGRIPWGRTVLVLELIAAMIFLGYTLVKKDTVFPWQESPYYVDVILPDAKGLYPKKEPAAGVAGAFAGKVERVVVENGQARVTLRLDPDLRGKIFNDATAEVRPTSVLQTLIVNVLPGNPSTGALDEGKAIPPENTTAFVHIDELTSVLDADTQAQIQILITEAARAFTGREPELRKILVELGRLTDGATPVAEALADRRVLLSRLVGNLDRLFTTLRTRGTQLASAIDLGSKTLSVTSAREPELTSAIRGLAPTVSELERALGASRGLAQPLTSALDELVPVADEVGPLAEGLRGLAPQASDFLELADDLARTGSEPVALFAEGVKGQAARVRRDQIPALEELVHLVDLIDKYKTGIVQFAESWSSALSANRRAGPYTQFAIVNAEILPEGLGLTRAATKSEAGESSKLALLLAEALELTCEDNPAACLIRFNTPGLPSEPVTAGHGEDGE